MATNYDAKSAELLALEESVGMKVDAMHSLGYTKPIEFNLVELTSGDVGQITGELPADARVIGIYMEAVSGTGSVDLQLITSTGTATLLSGLTPATAPVTEGLLADANGGELSLVGGGTVVVKGYVTIAVNA